MALKDHLLAALGSAVGAAVVFGLAWRDIQLTVVGAAAVSVAGYLGSVTRDILLSRRDKERNIS